MTKPQRLKLAALLLLLPLLVLGSLVVKNESDLAFSKTWRVKITGYDPRDLLYGHYLNFRFDWNVPTTDSTCTTEQNCCLCLNAQNETLVAHASMRVCEGTKQCTSSFPVANEKHCDSNLFGCSEDTSTFHPMAGQRYYVSEDAAPRLSSLLANRKNNLAIDLKITPSGKPIFGKLYIDDIEWHEFLGQHPDAGLPNTAAAPSHEHIWRMKINDARLYGSTLVFALNWSLPITRNACPDQKACCALCLKEQAGSSEPAISYKACGTSECLEALNVPYTNLNNPYHHDLGYDPGGAQKYSLSVEDTVLMTALLANAPQNMSIDVKTMGWGGAPEFKNLYVDGVEWHEYMRQHPAAQNH